MSAVRFERRVSLDIDVDQLVSRARGSGITNTARLHLPLALFHKRLLIDFDAIDEHGKSLALVTSDQDSYAAMAALLAIVDSNIGPSPSKFSAGMLQQLHKIVRTPPSLEDAATIFRASAAPQSLPIRMWELTTGYGVDANDIQMWNAAFKNPEFAERALEFTVQYLPIVAISTDESPQIVKYKTIESEPVADAGDWTFAERIGWDPVYFSIQTNSIGRAKREHVRVTSPGGVFAINAALRSVTMPDTGASLVPLTADDTYLRRITPERVMVYTQARRKSGLHEVLVGFRPAIKGFATPAIIAASISTVVLATGVIGQWTSGLLDTIADQTIEPAVALLLVIPSVLAAFLVREGEHEVRSKLLSVPRWLVGATSGLTVLAAFALVAGFSGHVLGIVWLSCGVPCGLILLFLIALCVRIESHHQSIIRRSIQQSMRNIQKF